jgi:hypothetical protein
MDNFLDQPVFKQIPRKVIKAISWTVCFSLVLLLVGGVMAYGIPNYGLDTPIRLHANEEINWFKLIKEEGKILILKEVAQFADKIFIFKFKWNLVNVGETVRIGRGPPSYTFNL